MGHITVWACGDMSAAIAVCTQLRLLGCKARVYDNLQHEAGNVAWRRGPKVIVGDGVVPHVDTTGCSDVLAFGEAACTMAGEIGATLGRSPPGLLPNVRTLTCRRDRGVLGPRNTHFPVDAVSSRQHVLDLPKGWAVEASESNGTPSVVVGMHTMLCMFTPRGRSLSSILDRVTHMWGLHRTDPGERALNRAIMAADDQVPRGAMVVLGYSGGLTSCVSAYVLRRAIKERVVACYVWTGLEQLPVANGMTKSGVEIVTVDARERTLAVLEGTIDFRERRRRLSRVFYEACTEAFPGAMLSQGATYEAILKGHGRPVSDTSGLVQPLEGLFRSEIALIAKQQKLPVMSAAGPPSGYADKIMGPFSKDALMLCRKVDASLGAQLAEVKTPTPGVRLQHTFTVDVWDPHVPKVCFGFEESEDELAWRRMRVRDGGLDMVVDTLRRDTHIPDLKVCYDVSLSLS